ncbi:type VII secretion-associated serine protease mycosin [Streptomyces flavofungini]|nr:type VII secretion-associated serine protease mycosin [Streptomyces flavofungini]WJV51258.1 type VII secretion-associated serine protease mycosin [Streptomyces flavofungini]
MAARTPHHTRWRTVASGAVSLLLTGVAATPAHAESVRDKQWHLNAMQAEKMWQTSTGKGVTVAVIDSGVNDELADLQGQVLPGKDEAPEPPGDEHTDYDGHGSTMAMLIAGTGRGNGGKGSRGLAPGAKILPIRTPDPYVNPFSVPARLSKAIRYAADSGARIINISLDSGMNPPELTRAVKYALDKGALIFAGTGNGGNSDVAYPAKIPGVVAVGAVGRNLRKTQESQFGPQVDIAAPGDEIYTTCPTGKGVCKGHGTSNATALASASAALIWSKHPDWTNNQVLRVMLNTIGGPSDGAKRNDSIGYGIVRPRVALQNPGDPGPADVYPLPDLKQATPESPAPSRSEAATPDSERASAAAPGTTEAGGDGTGVTTWIVTGVGAAALIGGAVAALAVRKRRAAGDVHVTGRP